MKEYIKPEVEFVDLTSEPITVQGTVSGDGYEDYSL